MRARRTACGSDENSRNQMPETWRIVNSARENHLLMAKSVAILSSRTAREEAAISEAHISGAKKLFTWPYAGPEPALANIESVEIKTALCAAVRSMAQSTLLTKASGGIRSGGNENNM